jgi:large subunit ribosomal protein L21e
MVKGKRIRQRGKLRLSEYFKKINNNDTVAVIIEKSIKRHFPKRLQGRTGIVTGSRGQFKIVKINDKDSVKTYIIHPIHLKKI